MKSRGVLYVVWGADDEFRKLLARSILSVREHHPKLPIEVRELDGERTLLDKVEMFVNPPWRTTLYLDHDTVVMGNLDYGFDMAERHGLAVCLNECPWLRRYPGELGDRVEYNTGVVFFNRTRLDIEAMRHKWEWFTQGRPSSIAFRDNGRGKIQFCNDQLGFALMLEELEINPFVLPYNWNLRPWVHRRWYGPVKIWHYRPDSPNREHNAELAPMELSGLKDGLLA